MAAEYDHFSHKMLALLENCTSMSHEGPYGRTVLRDAVMQLDFRKFDYTLSEEEFSKDVGGGQYQDGAIFMTTVKAAASRKNTVSDFLGFSEGSFPFVYPGVPIFKGCILSVVGRVELVNTRP
ncbi:hypothetical protein WN943_029367 [Citrus x changshan-huyou]